LGDLQVHYLRRMDGIRLIPKPLTKTQASISTQQELQERRGIQDDQRLSLSSRMRSAGLMEGFTGSW